MTPEQAQALREPFPPESVGKLPKPTRAENKKGNCGVCNGYHGLPAVHLDYVGHAATTDRLLAVDPAWSWEPMATDEHGLPKLDAKGNLWIRLTVAGVTRVGVGDGRNAKEVIGDAIRNAAMRFGVALDLWTKEDLHAATQGKPEPPTLRDAPPGEWGEGDAGATVRVARKASPGQLKAMGAAFGERGITERDERLAAVAEIIGRQVESAKDLTTTEASAVLDALKLPAVPDEPGPDRQEQLEGADE